MASLENKICYNMGTRDFPDIYVRALRPAALRLGHIYQANPSCPCYNYYIYDNLVLLTLTGWGMIFSVLKFCYEFFYHITDRYIVVMEIAA